MTRRRLAIVLLLILLPTLGYFVWRQTSVRMGGAPAALQGSEATEEEWIVREVVEDAAGMAIAASGNIRVLALEIEGAGADWRARAEGAALEVPLSLVPYFWAPEAYVGLARSFSPRTSATPRDPDRDFVRSLLSATTSELVDEDLRVGAALAADPSSVAAHEEAALLLGAIALRESSGEFSDPRPAFNRMTAHLAMARTLAESSDPSEAGRIARATLLVLTGRERDAEPWIQSIEDPAWRRILRMRSTDDWRVFDALEPPTRFEKLEWFRALARTLDTSTAMERYQKAFPPLPEDEPDLDWYRIAIEQFEGPSDGYYFRGDLLDRELEEIDRVRRRYGDGERALGLALDDPPRGLYGADGKLPRVVGWNYWAGFYQRHLCDHLVKADTYFRVSLGLPDAAEAYRAQADPKLQGTTLHPFVRMRRTARGGVQVEDIDGFEDVVRATVRNPERINGANWYFASWTTAQMALRQGMPRPADWFSAHLATGSTFDVRRRLWHFGRHQSPADVVIAQELAPSSGQVWRLFVEIPRAPPIATEELLRLMGPRAEYDLHALADVSASAERYRQDERPVQERMCAIEPSSCVHLGELLAVRGEDADAERAFRKAFDEATDRVHVSNHMKWLIRHYRGQGNTPEATMVAREGAETGSSQGLTNLAWLLEDLDELDQAESLHRDNFERYENPAELIAFYYRLSRIRGLTAHEQKLASAASEVFPNGLRTYRAEENDTPPVDGALIDSNSDKLREAGLMPGDVIVALDGFRVRSFAQYEAIRAFSESPELKLVVWRVNRYLDVDARSRDRRFGVGMLDYRPRLSIDSITN